MKIDELYPYWRDTHQELIETIEYLSEELLATKPHDGAQSIHEILFGFINDERYFIAHLVAGYDYEQPRWDVYDTAEKLMELIDVTRQVTIRVLEPYAITGLRAVRTIPSRPSDNFPETNMPVSWFFWHVMEREIECLAQMRLRIADARTVKKKAWE